MAGLNAQIRRWCGVNLVGDLYERASDAKFGLPLDRKRRERLDAIDRTQTLFIHVPKNAGMSISAALYGTQIKHATIRYYRRAAPRLLRRITSFAVLRDPVERFVSAFRYAQAGGSADNAVSAPFRQKYMCFSKIDDALDHLEAARSVYDIDHIFRPQSWYISDDAGQPMVDQLFMMDEMEDVQDFVRSRCGTALVRINAGKSAPVQLRTDQSKRIERLYAADVALIERRRLRDRSAEM